MYQAAGFQKPHPNLARDSNNNPISVTDWVDKIDLEVTATNMFNQASNEWGGKPKDQVKTWQLAKTNTNDWAKHPENIGKLIQEVGKDNWSRHRTLFEKARSGFELVIRARRGDNAKFQVKDIKKALGWEPTTMSLANPRNPSSPWKVVDFKQTIEDRAKSTGQSREVVAQQVSQATQTVYTKSKQAREHKTVMDANRRALERVNNCRA